MSVKKDLYITCPVCGYQYLISEIFLPQALIGKAKNVRRDFMGRILDHDGVIADRAEEYVCDRCNTPLNIRIDFNFRVSVNQQKNFSGDYASKIKSGKILDEG